MGTRHLVCAASTVHTSLGTTIAKKHCNGTPDHRERPDDSHHASDLGVVHRLKRTV